MLWQRVASAAVLIPVVGVAVYWGGIGLFVLIVLAGLLAGYEYVRLLRGHGLSPSYVLSLSLIALFLADAQWPRLELWRWGLALLPLAGLTVEVFRGNAPGSLSSWALTIAGGVYIGFSLSHFIRLRALNEGLYWLVLALLGTWICDSAAYCVGRSMGRHSFFPRISPRKTWEGAVAGLIFGVIAVVPLGCLMLGLGVMRALLLGLLLVLGATFGDLSESVIKRQVGVKDSSALIPGHGGMLDRVDSLLFVVPIVYCFAISIA